MKFTKTSWTWMLAVAFFVTSLTGCLGGSTATGVEDDGSSDDATGSDPSEFYVTVGNSTEIKYHVRTQASFGTACSISQTASNQDLTCLIDVPEGDLHFHGLKIKYNTPAGMCHYLRRSTYWFYNYEFGIGPSSVTVNVTTDASNNVTASSCSVNGGGNVACNTLAELNVKTSDQTVTCKYDHTSAEGPNCCIGKYTLTVNKTDSGTGTTTSNVTDANWGGDIQSCIGGAGRTNWEAYSKSGFPISVLTNSSSGESENYEITAPINVATDYYNISIANYYTPATHSHDGYTLATVSTLPYFADPIDDRDGSDLRGYTSNIPYTFECLDEGYEVLHRIRVYVRDWDYYGDYLNYIASSGVTSVPDRGSGVEGVDCTGVTGPCDDKLDLDDFVNLILGAPYETATTSLRYKNFPEQEY